MLSGHRLTRVTQSTIRSVSDINSVEMRSQTVMTGQTSKKSYSSFSRSSRDPGRVLVHDCPVLVLRHLRNFHFKTMLEGHIRKKP
ncbi:hypothetical protein TNCV_1799341 [Trichonephila clavipes]|uniref:Uncharacterized protein n=1 Tax=Trichonephila clavipes TaxID=2585209 RepID=A0A8X6SER5_TRICX|nr:hypothetical protein TNCV_1799341 [Trichonephila clavipes]